MSHFLEPPRIVASVLDAQSHLVSVVDASGALIMRPPSGAVVLEVWAAHVPAGASVERAYVSFSWMRPATAFPVPVQVSAVTGRDPSLTSAGRSHLFYKARWVREGSAVSTWSNVAVVEDTGQRSPQSQAGWDGGGQR